MAELGVGGGVLVPTALLWALLAVALAAGLRAVLRAAGLYRFVWHPALFDLAVTVLLMGAVVAVASRVVGP